MQKMNIRAIKKRARITLKKTKPDYRKLVFLHGAVSAGAMVLVMLLSYLVSLMDQNSGGLAGMQNGAILNTTQSILSLTVSCVLPFWGVGILFTSLLVVRGQMVNFSMLTQGFRRVGPLLRYGILLVAILMGVAIGCSYVASIYMIVVPIPEAVAVALKPYASEELIDPNVLMESLPPEFWRYMAPAFGLIAVAMIAVMIPILCRFSMAQYVILDGEGVGARMSMGISSAMTKGYRWDIFKLELSFWWYYLLQFLLAALVELPELLVVMGVTLPISPDVLGLITYLVYSGLSLVLLYFAGAYVGTTNACAFEFLLTRQRELAMANAPAPESYQPPVNPPALPE